MSTPLGRPLPRRPRLGFLGVGWIGRHRMEAIHRSECAEVAAISDATPAARDEALASAPKSEVVDSLDAMLELELDGIVIATPSALHAEQSIRALNRGVAVFCQKPLGRNVREVQEVIAAAKRANRLLGVDLSYRFTDGVRQIRERIREGALGDIYAVNLVFHNAYGPDKPWFYDARQSGGGCLMDLGIHLVDLALWTLDFPKVDRVEGRLLAQGKVLERREAQVEDYAAAQLALGSGAVVQLACSWKLPAGCDAVIEASFYGTKGGASFKNVNGSFYDFTAELFHGTSRERLAEPPDAWGGRAAVAWAEQLSVSREFNAEAEQLVEATAVLDRIYGQGPA